MRLQWARVGPKPKEGLVCLGASHMKTQTLRHMEGGHGMTEVGLRVEQQPRGPKDHQRPPEARGSQEAGFPGDSGGPWNGWHFDFGLLASRILGRYISVVLSRSLWGSAMTALRN